MAGEKLLNEFMCKGAKPRDGIYYLNDGAGLRLRVRPNGSRHWIYRYRFGGKEKSSSLGTYPQVSLREARLRASQAKANLYDGQDPVVLRRVAKAQQKTSSQQLFESVANAWLSHNKESWSSHHHERNTGLVRRYLLPELGKMPMDSIEEAYLFNVLKKVYDSGVKESARRARAVAAQIFSHGRALHLCSNNPARDMSDNPYFKKPPVEHYKALPQAEMPELIRKLAVRGDAQLLEIQTVGGLLMAIYTGLRDSSIRGATWQEIDFERRLWTVPGSRMKSRREFLCPLPSQAITVLKELESYTYKGPESFVFGSRSKQGFLSENTLRKGLHRLGFMATLHGLRSLLTDVLSEHGFNPDWIEKQLDHQERNQVRAAYLRTAFLEQRAGMMEWFANWCEGKHQTTKVIQLRGN